MGEHKKKLRSLSFLENIKIGNPKRKLSFEKIKESFQNKTLYGVSIVDIYTSEELKEKFKEFSLIIKTSFISRQDVGSYLKNVAEEHNLLKKPQKYLISSYLAEKFFKQFGNGQILSGNGFEKYQNL